MDIRNMLRASMPLIMMGIVLVLVSFALQVASLLLTGPKDIVMVLPVLGATSVPELASTAFSYLLYPIFFVVYLWGGIRGIKRYRLDTTGSALAVALSYVVAGFLNLALGVLISLLVINDIIHTLRFGTLESTLATVVFGETAGAMGIAFTGLCGVGILAIGALMNFVVGGVGAIIAQR
jgi:hypothetical protein